uniref:Uncharacterized protein n=1 Tax=Rhizophora mucronata TaxID=61149 RepID=A0A2P2Q4D6_RHIMU
MIGFCYWEWIIYMAGIAKLDLLLFLFHGSKNGDTWSYALTFLLVEARLYGLWSGARYLVPVLPRGIRA